MSEMPNDLHDLLNAYFFDKNLKSTAKSFFKLEVDSNLELREIITALREDLRKCNALDYNKEDWNEGFSSNYPLEIYDTYSPQALTKNNKELIEKAIDHMVIKGTLYNSYSQSKENITECIRALELMLDKADEHKKSKKFFPYSLKKFDAIGGPIAACLNHAYNKLKNPEGTACFTEEDTNSLRDLIKTLKDNSKGSEELTSDEQANIKQALGTIRQIGAKDDAKTLILNTTSSLSGALQGAAMLIKGGLDRSMQYCNLPTLYIGATPKQALSSTLSCKEDFIDFCKTKTFRDFIKRHTNDGYVNAGIRGILGVVMGNINTQEIGGTEVVINNHSYQRIINIIPDVLKKSEEAMVLNNTTEQLDGLLGSVHDLLNLKPEDAADLPTLTYYIIQTLSDFSKIQDDDILKELDGLHEEILRDLGIELQANSPHKAGGKLVGKLLVCLEKLSLDDIKELFKKKGQGANNAYLLKLVEDKTELLSQVGQDATTVCDYIDILKKLMLKDPKNLYIKDNAQVSDCLSLIGRYAAVNDGKDFPKLAISYVHFIESGEPLEQYEQQLKDHKEQDVYVEDCKERFEVYRKMFTEDPPLSKYDYAFKILQKRANTSKKDAKSQQKYQAVFDAITNTKGDYENAKKTLNKKFYSRTLTKQIGKYIDIKIEHEKYEASKNNNANSADDIKDAYFKLTDATAKFTKSIGDDNDIALGDFDLFLHDFMLHTQERIDTRVNSQEPLGVLYDQARQLIQCIKSDKNNLYDENVFSPLEGAIAQRNAKQVIGECSAIMREYENQVSDENRKNEFIKVKMQLDYFTNPPNMALIEHAVDMLLKLDLGNPDDSMDPDGTKYKEALKAIADVGLAIGVLHQWQLDSRFSEAGHNTQPVASGSIKKWLRYFELVVARLWLKLQSTVSFEKNTKDILTTLKRLISHIEHDASFSDELMEKINSNIKQIASVKEVSQLEPQISELINGLIEHIHTISEDEKNELGILVKGVIAYFISDEKTMEKYFEVYEANKNNTKTDNIEVKPVKIRGVSGSVRSAITTVKSKVCSTRRLIEAKRAPKMAGGSRNNTPKSKS